MDKDENTDNSLTSDDEPLPLGEPLHQASPSESSNTEAPAPEAPTVNNPTESTPEPTSAEPTSPSSPLTNYPSPLEPATSVNPTDAEPSVATSPEPTSPPVVVSSDSQSGESTTSAVGDMPTNVPSQVPPVSPNPSSSHKRFKLMIIVLVGLLIICGGFAVAYVAMTLPNKPSSLLKAAMLNTLKANNFSFTTTETYQSGSKSQISPFTVDANGQINRSEKAYALNISFSGFGVNNIGLEGRFVNQNLYIKANGLNAIAGLLGSIDPSMSSSINTLANDLSNQWIEIDHSLLSEAGISCYLNDNLSFNQNDINMINDDYNEHPFLTINSSSNVTLNSQPAEEFQVTASNKQTLAFVANLENLSLVKSAEQCKGGSGIPSLFKSLGGTKATNSTTHLTLWVNKSMKQITQIRTTENLPNNGGSVAVTVQQVPNAATSITAPSNAESVDQVIVKLQPVLNQLNISNLNLNSLKQSFVSNAKSSI